MEKIVVAHFAEKRSLVYAATAGAAICICMLLTAQPAIVEQLGRLGYFRSHYTYWLLIFSTAWLGGIVCLLYIFALARQLIFYNCAAVWKDGDQLVYLNRRYFSVQLNDIESINLGSCGRFNSPAIVLRLHNDREKAIPLRLLRESGETVMERLREANLPASLS
jgi:hypothetical protein